MLQNELLFTILNYLKFNIKSYNESFYINIQEKTNLIYYINNIIIISEDNNYLIKFKKGLY